MITARFRPGLTGKRNGRHLDAENIGIFGVHPEAFINLPLLPNLKMDHKVDFLRLLYRTHSENAAHVHNADTAQLYVMADQLRRAADERFRRHALDFDRVVRNEAGARV